MHRHPRLLPTARLVAMPSSKAGRHRGGGTCFSGCFGFGGGGRARAAAGPVLQVHPEPRAEPDSPSTDCSGPQHCWGGARLLGSGVGGAGLAAAQLREREERALKAQEHLPRGSIFSHLKEAPPDPIMRTAIDFAADPDPRKVNLGVGAYRNEEGKPHILEVVRYAEFDILRDLGTKVNKEYATIDGPAELKRLTQNLVFGEHSQAVRAGRVCSIQALSGTGSLRVCAEFLKVHLPEVREVWISDPSWGNHFAIFQRAGLQTKTYPYFNAAYNTFDCDGMIKALWMAPRGAAVVLHACAHNPTGVDPSEAEWRAIAEVCRERGLVPLLDSAYQGYASGDLDRDAFSIRLFEQMGFEFFVCQSFAKNLGLYGERVGMLHVVCAGSVQAKTVLSQLKMVIRPMYSNPPIHGALLVMKILGDVVRFAEWKVQLKEMADRINEARILLRNGLEAKGTPGRWDHITTQIGMFSYTGLSEAMCERLIKEHHIYLLKSGRISMAGLNRKNMQYMVDCVDEVVRFCGAR